MSPMSNQYVKPNQGRYNMGAILDLVEMAKSPLGIVVVVALAAGIYYFVRWVMKEDDEGQK